MEIKTRKHFNDILKELALEITEEELEEITTTGDVEGYNTPNAFSGGKDKDNKKKKKNATNSTGYTLVNEKIEDKDINIIKKLIRDVIGDVFRDIWIKRNSWK